MDNSLHKQIAGLMEQLKYFTESSIEVPEQQLMNAIDEELNELGAVMVKLGVSYLCTVLSPLPRILSTV